MGSTRPVGERSNDVGDRMSAVVADSDLVALDELPLHAIASRIVEYDCPGLSVLSVSLCRVEPSHFIATRLALLFKTPRLPGKGSDGTDRGDHGPDGGEPVGDCGPLICNVDELLR